MVNVGKSKGDGWYLGILVISVLLMIALWVFDLFLQEKDLETGRRVISAELQQQNDRVDKLEAELKACQESKTPK